ncbi:Major facilitator superfamily domain general substrate transporter [Penicillium paradoxum]|uniref:Major facilitator superfamily domain general substrate transporter n=1 Tax=Penicillium paradoxum TaxID=176176 RepID=UPI0025470AC2|nr:Major facilitator superfamily domain general substrate transporter [Penicillium paradoxum]KAJ5788357.1 Major facilitator superfamily domain general substrate transporter [Penicillium paradoxum]
METPNERADSIPSGTLATARQAFGDLFIWKQRVEITNEHGETYAEWQTPEPIKNPISLMAQLSARDWVFFLVGLLAWTADAFDFHALSIQTVKLAKYYDRSKTDITTAITLTLLLRSVGAAFFGFAGDKYGRKWPMVINMIVLGLLQVATIYSQTFQQFLAVRSLFGLFMGGVYGNAMAMALEHCPVNARGLMSGILQQGYSMGYVFAACANLGIGGETESWKTVFWIAAGLSIGVGLIRICFPESNMLGKEWRMCIYCIILMTWFNYYSHTSQDSYTTFMLTAKELDNAGASRASILMKTGACVGGTIIGYLSQFFGRRRAIIFAALVSGILIPAWILPEGEASLSASGFFMQFFVQGAWGVIPVHLNELSPPAFRSSFTGLTYQIGNMISSPSAQIVNAISESNSVTSKSGHRVDAYGPVMGIATAIIALGIMVTTAIGPEKRGRRFESVVAAVDETAEAKNMDLETGTMEDKSQGETIEMAEEKK